MPLLKLIKKLNLGYALELLGAQLILVDIIEVFCARKLPARRKIPECRTSSAHTPCSKASRETMEGLREYGEQRPPCFLRVKVWVSL